MSAPLDPGADFLALQKTLAGRYSLERELGRGGMGVVYLAQDVGLDRPVALKVLPSALAARPELRERFVREARTAARLSHPHIVPIHLVDAADDVVFFVMSFVEGETLGERVRKRGPVPPREASRILREVAWALAYAHGQGVVHRDVKPDNILLEAGSGRALVTDFGIAHAGAAAGLAGTGEILGTPEYMSPEQARGEDVDGRSDLYALGVVGHYMLSGRLPFQGSTPQATLALQLTRPAPALASIAGEVPAPLADVIDRCLEKDPGARVQGGEELAGILGRLLLDRREVPVPIRLFQEQSRESTGAIVGVSMIVVMTITITYVMMEVGEPLADVLPGLVLTLGLMLLPPAMLGMMARRLLKAGYGHDELVRALRSDLDERRRDLVPRVEERTAVDVWAPRLGWAGLIAFVLGMVGLLVPSIPESLLEMLLLAGSPLALGGAAVTAIRHSMREGAPGARWLSFWESPLGRGVFSMAGLGVDPGTASGGSYRPTELAIGMAAERLFEELPKDVRRSLGDVPGVLAALEGHAEEMRARVKELDGVLADVGRPEAGGGDPSAARSLAGRRDSVEDEVRRARDAAGERLREVVGALESLRLELLRLHAGSGDVPAMTMDIAAARALAEDAGHLAEGHREVSEMLGHGLPRLEKADTPQPA